MAWRLAGDYVASCSCAGLCPCPVDERPTSDSGECRGVALFHVASGNLDDTDLSGVSFAFVNYFPSNITAGSWKVGIVVDEAASDQQSDALGKILSGESGGPFADFVPLIAENIGMARAKVAISDAGGSIGGMSEFSFDPYRGVDGSATTIRNAMFGFSVEYEVGKTTGRSDALGIGFDGSYGERAEFEFSDAGAEVHGRV